MIICDYDHMMWKEVERSGIIGKAIACYSYIRLVTIEDLEISQQKNLV